MDSSRVINMATPLTAKTAPAATKQSSTPAATKRDTLPPATQSRPAPKVFTTGIMMVRDGNMFRVHEVLPNSGGAAAQIVTGDRIIGIDGVPAANINLNEMKGGGEGSSTKLTLLRNGAPVTVIVQRLTPMAVVKKKLSLDIADMSEVLERKISP